MREIFVAAEAEFADNARKVVVTEGGEIGIFRIDGAFYAWRNTCPHQGGPVCQGRLMKGVEERLDSERRSLGIHYAEGHMHLVCPWHGYEFDVRTGRHAGVPTLRLQSHPVTIRDGDVYVVLGY